MMLLVFFHPRLPCVVVPKIHVRLLAHWRLIQLRPSPPGDKPQKRHFCCLFLDVFRPARSKKKSLYNTNGEKKKVPPKPTLAPEKWLHQPFFQVLRYIQGGYIMSTLDHKVLLSNSENSSATKSWQRSNKTSTRNTARVTPPSGPPTIVINGVLTLINGRK